MDKIKVFKALADETRFRLFILLLHHEFNVNEMVQALDMGQSRISRHLKILSESGVLTSRRNGSFVYYHAVINEENQALIDYLRQDLESTSGLKQDLQRAEAIYSERKDRTARFFQNVAPDWDELKNEILGPVDLNALIAEEVWPGQVAVDLGCGTGELALRLEQKAQKVIGIDSSPGMLEQARKRIAHNGHRVELRLGELEHLPLRDETADMAIVSMALHTLSVPAVGIREARRVLKQGGRLVLVDFDKHDQPDVRDRFGGPWMGLATDEVRQWLEDAGFILQRTQQIEVKNGLCINMFVADKDQHIFR
ncbi:MAG: metalloregulator ArsR/SmtB family transcription factor [Desulfovermiculus sp.]